MPQESNMSDELRVLKSIECKLDQLLRWSRFASLQQLRNVLTQNLATDKELLIYELSDGEHTTREIAELLKIGSNSTVAGYWKKWGKLGIVEQSQNRQGRYQRFCSLEEVGLTIPPMSKSGTEPAPEEIEEETADERQNQ
jgi:hypothetical protein